MFTVENMLQIPAFEGQGIIVGRKGINREIKTARVMDAPDRLF